LFTTKHTKNGKGGFARVPSEATSAIGAKERESRISEN